MITIDPKLDSSNELTFPTMRIVFPVLLALCVVSGAQELSMSDLVRRTLQHQPQLSEDSMDLDRAVNQVDLLKRKVILPRFEVSVGFGPAPGFRLMPNPDTTKSDTVRQYAWGEIGPTFGTDINIAQPLNVGRLRAGMVAARANVRLAIAELDVHRSDVVKDVLNYLFGYQYATRTRVMLEEASTRLDSVETSIQTKIDNDDEDASQTDLFNLRIGRYELEKSLQEAKLGQKRARQGLAFSLGVSDPDSMRITDSLLEPLAELPGIDTLVQALAHPDLRRLSAGLDAKKALVEVERASLGPDMFIFGKFSYTKAWVYNRNKQNQDVLVTDPLNSVSGMIGVGMTWHLNFWSQLGEVHRAELEWQQLRRKEAYARKGLESLLRDAWLKYSSLGERQISAQKGKDAAEALLHSIAIQFDVDPSKGKDMIGPYKTLLDFKNKYWETIYERNKAALDVLQASGKLLDSPVLGGPFLN